MAYRLLRKRTVKLQSPARSRTPVAFCANSNKNNEHDERSLQERETKARKPHPNRIIISFPIHPVCLLYNVSDQLHDSDVSKAVVNLYKKVIVEQTELNHSELNQEMMHNYSLEKIWSDITDSLEVFEQFPEIMQLCTSDIFLLSGFLQLIKT